MSLNNSDLSVNCYAIRRVNPFLGVLQIIETEGGRAVSSNGVVWDIEIIADNNVDWGSLSSSKSEKTFYRYGLWSLDEGLVNRPLSPSLDNDPMSEACNIIIECIKSSISHLPFRLLDTEELWLLDEIDKLPLVLLASVVPGHKRPSPEPKKWLAHLGAQGISGQLKFAESDQLMLQVKQRAGFNLTKTWLQRQQDGSAISESSGIRYDKNQMPAYLIRSTWPTIEQEQRVQAFIHWIAPSLLTLQGLDRHQRLYLEQKLTVQAISIAYHVRLYPEIIDSSCINSAQVQAVLQKTR